MNFLYFGRLDKEKGFDAILKTIEHFGKQDKNLPFEMFIFGTGVLEKQLLQVTSKYKQIHFFGRQSLATIKRYVLNCSFTLVPSDFLETFGLTALNSLSFGLPVIGYKKGGLEQFVIDEFDLFASKGKSTDQRLIHAIETILKKYTDDSLLEELKKSSRAIAEKYTVAAWKNNFKDLIQDEKFAHKKRKKILMVTDFSSKLGGIETFVYDAKKILEDEGYRVELIGKKIPSGKLGKLYKVCGIFLGIFNIFFMIRLQSLVKKYEPDLIRFHSTLRWIGWLPIAYIGKYECTKWMMFHDLGYFYPFPSQLFNLNDIAYPLTLKSFVLSARTKNPLKIIGLMLKYISLKLLKYTAKKHIDRFLVPSKFMEKVVEKSFEIPGKNVETMSLFLQE